MNKQQVAIYTFKNTSTFVSGITNVKCLFKHVYNGEKNLKNEKSNNQSLYFYEDQVR